MDTTRLPIPPPGIRGTATSRPLPVTGTSATWPSFPQLNPHRGQTRWSLRMK